MKPIKMIMILVIQLLTMNYAIAQNNQFEKPIESAIHPDNIQKEEKKLASDSITHEMPDKAPQRSRKLAVAAAVFIGMSAITTFFLIHSIDHAIENSKHKTIHFTI